MSARELVVLGTSSQVPTRYRNHNGYLLLWDDRGLLFDPGEGTQRQLLLAGVAASRITRILVTHFHGDHCLGLPGILQRLSLDQVQHEVGVHFPGSGEAYFERLRYASIYKQQATILPHPVRAEGEVHVDDRLRIIAKYLDHRVPTLGWRVEERDRWSFVPELLEDRGLTGPDVGLLRERGELLIGGEHLRLEDVAELRTGQVMTFLMDTRNCPATVELARGADLLVCESTYLDSEAREAHAHGHLTASDAGRIAAEAVARALVLTHFSQRYADSRGHVAEAQSVYNGVVHAARDLDRIKVPSRPRRPADRPSG